MLLGIYSQWQVLSRALRVATEGEQLWRWATGNEQSCVEPSALVPVQQFRALGGLVKLLQKDPSEAIPVKWFTERWRLYKKIYILHLNPSRVFLRAHHNKCKYCHPKIKWVKSACFRFLCCSAALRFLRGWRFAAWTPQRCRAVAGGGPVLSLAESKCSYSRVVLCIQRFYQRV